MGGAATLEDGLEQGARRDGVTHRMVRIDRLGRQSEAGVDGGCTLDRADLTREPILHSDPNARALGVDRSHHGALDDRDTTTPIGPPIGSMITIDPASGNAVRPSRRSATSITGAPTV